MFQSSAVLGHVNNVEESVSLHGLEEEGVDVGVIVKEIFVGDLGYSREYAMFLLGPQSEKRSMALCNSDIYQPREKSEIKELPWNKS